VELPETPGSGYAWQLADVPAAVREVGRDYREAPPTSDPIAGGSGVRTFRLEVGEQGRHQLEFLLRRPWEESALERRIVTLVVEDDGAPRTG
jgi:predicted secreted protein